MSLTLFLVLAIGCVSVYAFFIARRQKDVEDEMLSQYDVKQEALRLLNDDKRLSSLVVLLSFADREKSATGDMSSTRRLIYEIRQRVVLHLFDRGTRDINMVSAQIVVIARSIEKSRKRKR
jgi:hypothetical protein